MTIKQLGGVFGRNPTFNDVTIEGQLTFDGDIDINSDLKVNGDLDVTGEGLFDGNVGINTDSPSSPTGKCLTVYDTSFPRINLKNSTTGDGATDGMEFYLNGANAFLNNREAGSIGFGTGNVVHMTLNTTGNLAFASGKGIDFSATAGTGTSELLDDYEEGVWTPTYAITGGSFSSITYNAYTGGVYTKVGNVVYVSGYITTNSAVVSVDGGLTIEGLPFATGSGTGLSTRSAVTIGEVVAFGTNYPTSGRFQAGASRIYLNERSSANGASTFLQASNMGNTTVDNQISFSGFYMI